MGFYDNLRRHRSDSDALASCVNDVVTKLCTNDARVHGPGMLYGKIQSGKTGAFLGVIAGAFDNGFDIALVLTKGTRSLATQTVQRVRRDFRAEINDETIIVDDIMTLPERLTKNELRRKIIIVAKKEVNNLGRLLDFLQHENYGFATKRILIIDDEADFASVRFTRRDRVVEQGSIAEAIDSIRTVSQRTAMLQVTATPYSLYLQPERYGDDQASLLKRPSFTNLVPIHSAYVGGDDYFSEFDETNYRSFLFQEVSDDELAVLKDDSVAELSDAIRRDEAPAFVRSLCAFLIGAAIRGNDPEHAPQPRDRKYAMVLHTDVAKTKHHAQTELVQLVMKLFLRSIESGDGWFQRIFLTEWTSLSKSYSCAGGIAEQKATHQHVARILRDEEYTIQAVNSDKNVDSLLDSETAELILRETCNIFVGGNILDRGITIPRLISFYYGRNPKVMQADTVLQHSRMYGARTPMDVAVTRFFTTRNVYNRLKMIHQSDTILREDFEREVRTGASNVVLLSKSPKADSDGSRFSFCSVSKIALSNVVTLREDSAITLDNFETRGGRQVERILRKIEGMIRSEWRDSDSSHFIEHDYAADIMSELSSVLHPCKGALVNWDVMNGLLDCCTKTEVNDRRVIKLLAITGRDLNRAASMGKSADSIMSRGLRNRIYGSHRNNPTLVLLQQQGSADQGWNDYPFWWPILISPTKCKSMMYTASLPIA